jgi:hypothetical protein
MPINDGLQSHWSATLQPVKALPITPLVGTLTQSASTAITFETESTGAGGTHCINGAQAYSDWTFAGAPSFAIGNQLSYCTWMRLTPSTPVGFYATDITGGGQPRLIFMVNHSNAAGNVGYFTGAAFGNLEFAWPVDSNWHLGCWVQDASHMRFYFDGVAVGTPKTLLYPGGAGYTQSINKCGVLKRDTTRFYSRAITQSEALELFTAGRNEAFGTGNPPINTVAPAISGSLIAGQILTCSTGTWTGDAPITYSYSWERAPTNTSDWSAVGTDLPTYQTANPGDVGYDIRCLVTATNAAGSDDALSAAVGPITAPAPTFQPAWASPSSRITQHFGI